MPLVLHSQIDYCISQTMFIVTKVGEVLGTGQEFEAFALGYVAKKHRYIHYLQISTATLGQ